MTEESTTAGMSKIDLFNFKRNLNAALEVYDDIDKSLKEKLLNYLIEGADPSCLLEIKAALGNKGTETFFKLNSGSPRARDMRQGKTLHKCYTQYPIPEKYYFRLAEWLSVNEPFSSGKIQGDNRLPEWLNTLVHGYQALSEGFYSAQTQICVVEVAKSLTKEELSALLRVLMEGGDYHSMGNVLSHAKHVTKLFSQHPDEFDAALRAASSESVERTLDMFLSDKFPCASILPTVVDSLCKGGKRVRAVATQIAAMNLEAAQAPLLEKLKQGSAGERTAAAETLTQLYGTSIAADLKAALKAEKGGRLRQTFESLLEQINDTAASDQPTADGSSTAMAIQLPPVDMPLDPIPLPEGFRESFAKFLEKSQAKFEEQYQKQLAHYNSSEKESWMRKPDRPEDFEGPLQAELCKYMEGTVAKPDFGTATTKSRVKPSVQALARALLNNSLVSWCDPKRLHLLHVLRLLKASDLLHSNLHGVHVQSSILESHRLAQDKPYGLREIDAGIARVLGQTGLLVKSYLGYGHSNFDLEDEAVWPFFLEHINELRDAILGVSVERYDYFQSERRRYAIAVAGMMPVMPKAVENAIWALALGEAKTDRPLARRALSKCSGRLERGLQAIVDGKQMIRIAGAELLGELGDPAAVEPLKKALKAEKQETVKGSFLQAIELLGGDVEEFLGRRKQLLDAKKALEKKMPKGMEWFPLDALPTVRWTEDNKPVAPEIVRWWVIQSVQFKLPTCGALLRRAMNMCRPDDAAALAKFVLTAWIGYDTQVPNPTDTLAAATERANKEYQANKWIKEYYKTVEAYRDELLKQMQGQFLNSAVGEKGALAVVAAGGDKQCVRIIEKYIRTYHGHRLAQSKSLLEVLGWIDDPLAVQVLLSLGNRFRTAAIRKRAAELVQELADRKGWTMEQLADRTIPDAGFVQARDEDGRPIGKRAELVLDYGARKFSVIMNDDLEPVISRDDGKEVKALPAAAKEDDPELVKAAKAEFTAAKKTVKDVVKLLAEQLYEAVCSQRTWVASEWKSFLATHPIAGALCRRVVWRAHAVDNPEKTVLFRPLEDGTFTDVEDNSVALNDTDVITVAHSSLMTSEEEQAWITHLKDYDVPKLFVQFGRASYRLAEGDGTKTDIDAFQGHMLTTYLLRNKATKLGWQRGSAQDGGSFNDYFKPFRAVGITAMLEFTGSYLPEGDIPAGLRSVYFVPIKGNEDEGDTWNPSKLKLSKVPAILISECYNDLRDIAAEGSGFDPEWEKKGLW